MKVNGCDCTIVIKTVNHEFDVPYSEETIRDAVSLLQEEAAIEDEGNCKAVVKKCGVTGCVVTPLTLMTAPLLLYLAFGSAGKPLFVSETRNIYSSKLNLLPLEDTECFDLIQDRTINNEQLAMSNERKLFEGCRIKSFELRIERDQALKLKLDVCGETPAAAYLYTDAVVRERGERFKGDCVDYWINGKENHFIYGVTLSVKKEGGTKTEIWIRRELQCGNDLLENIGEFVITARLLCDKYEFRNYGIFKITLKNLVLISDETYINSADTVIDPLRYYVSGSVSADVFTSNDEEIQ